MTSLPPKRIEPLNSRELESIAEELQPLVGAQLQDCLQAEGEFGLAFYQEREMFWLWVDLEPTRPVMIRSHGSPPPGRRKKLTRPLTLFLRSRFLGRRLERVQASAESGRVLVLSFHRGRDEAETGPVEIEIRLFPHGQNVIARDADKSISELKPKGLPAVGSRLLGEARPWSEIEAAWYALKMPRTVSADESAPRGALEREYERLIEKKERALAQMRIELEAKIFAPYAEIGEWLKTNATLDVPEAWRVWIDSSATLSENIEECFRRAKENARKSQGARERISKVEAELEDLRVGGIDKFATGRTRAGVAPSAAKSLLAKADVRGRKLEVAPDLEAYIGKSGADNLALLRKAQPFDYWLHLRDQPGAHAILRRTRGRAVSDLEFDRVGRWVVEQSLGKRAADLKGERYELLIVECRHVRPIKGDKLGRVHYTHDRVMGLRF